MIKLMSLASNQLSGNLPSTMFYELPNLEELYLNNNHFDGDIPESISNSSNLYFIELSDNKFTGPIPNSLGNLRFLRVLDLTDNNLVSDSSSPELSFISFLANSKNLRKISVSNNPLNGILPDSVGNLSTSLERIYAYSCNLSGSIPHGVGKLSNLIILSLYNNQLTGSLPITITGLQKLQVIDLRRNKLSQVSLDCFCDFENLGWIYLGYNQILGSIPECLGNVTSLRYLYLNSNRFNSTLPKNLWNLKDLLVLDLSSNSVTGPLPLEIKNLKIATSINLSMNHFSGGIPTTIGEMQNLIYLSLAHNQLHGSIPESISNILSLETLDLSHNSLSGSIPMSLDTLKYLTYFNVSFNNLSGEIPSNGPFTNFTSESFISNEAFCGAQRFHVPPCARFSAQRSRTKKMYAIIFVLIGVIIVLVSVFGFVYQRYRRKVKSPIEADLPLLVIQERISYYKIVQATDGYSERNFLGKGSFGSVYRGTFDDGRAVAVKVFDLQLEGAFKGFDAECEVLRNLRHRNLTKVISSCSNPDFKALILEFMPNGSLEKWLYFNDCFLDLIQRLDILVDVACAMQYLHYECSTPVVHCDLKPSNVLLDQDMVAHVSDFGLAKLLAQEDSNIYTKTLATICYLAPGILKLKHMISVSSFFFSQNLLKFSKFNISFIFLTTYDE